jgi:hypothetical protein
MNKVFVKVAELKDGGNLKSFLSDIDKLINLTPDEFKNDLILELDTDERYGSCYAFLTIGYWRPPTQEEVEKDKKELENKVARRIAAEKLEYERLKKQFETKI